VTAAIWILSVLLIAGFAFFGALAAALLALHATT
jgi:hypothetical protein